MTACMSSSDPFHRESSFDRIGGVGLADLFAVA
jgi:hypothetical protein